MGDALVAESATPDEPWIGLRQPTQCVLWERPDLVNGVDRFDTVEELIDESHLSRSVLKCRECGQLYFYEFYEIVDWEEGNDRIYWTFIPVSEPMISSSLQ
jgi:hypothetical protein